MPAGHRILALVTDAFGGHGGIARYNRDMLSALAASPAVDWALALPRLASPIASALPPKLQQVPPAPGRMAFSLRALATAVRRRPIDTIFCGHLYMAPLAAALARMTGARLWLQLHGIEAWQRPDRATARAAARACFVSSVSRCTRRRFLAWADVDPQRVRVIPNTVEPRFCRGPKPEGLARRLGLDGGKILLTVSRLAAAERYKGHDRVIRALPAVLQRHPGAMYLIVGDGEDRTRLERLAVEQGIAGAVRFAGHVPDADLLDYYRLADVFVMPSTGEGFGIVFLEALACGLPVVAGNVDGSVDALAEGTLGTLVAPDDTAQIARALCDILDSPNPPAPDAVDRFARANFVRHIDDVVRSLR